MKEQFTGIQKKGNGRPTRRGGDKGGKEKGKEEGGRRKERVNLNEAEAEQWMCS